MSAHFDDLVAVMARLRGPDGCPWDRQQTLESLRAYLLEEAHETLEAIDLRDPDRLREELGDLLLEVVFLAQVCSERRLFDIEDVARGIHEKLVRRHPHVFGGTRAFGPEEALRRWEEIKNDEKAAAGERSVLSGVPASLPALLRAHRLSTKAALVGFDWTAKQGLYDKVQEELREFQEASDRADAQATQEELGDLLFITANLGRRAGVDPEAALQAANAKFTARFRYIEEALRRRGLSPCAENASEMEALWEEAKRKEREAGGDQPRSSR